MKSRKPLIGITSDFTSGDRQPLAGKEPTYFLRARYVSAIEENGGIPLVLPISRDEEVLEHLLEEIEGLLLTGSGPDLDPALYGEAKRHRFKVMNEARAAFEMAIARQAMQRGVPVLGVCGGMQVLNVSLGGSLVQDISAEIDGALRHQQKQEAVKPSHEVRIIQGSQLSWIVQAPVIEVNSSHHQAIRTLGRDLRTNAIAPDGVIEGIECPEVEFAIGVQWHPEFLYRQDRHSRCIFEAFLQKAAPA